MNSLLKQLSDHGDLYPLSYVFAGFIARLCDADEDSLLAYSAALVSQNNQNGDVCVELELYADQPLFASVHLAADDLPRGVETGEWVKSLMTSRCVGEPGEDSPLIVEDGRLYLNRYWRYEQAVAEQIAARLAPLPDADASSFSGALAGLFPRSGGEASPDEQALAAALAAMRRWLVISGGPGTGKTTTVVKILALLLAQQPDMRIRLVAPTGKAAARLGEAIVSRVEDLAVDAQTRDLIPREASTIHRLLGYSRRGFKYSARNPLALDCLVVDEASMLDLTLIYHLLEALPAQARIILLGDRDQLASVAAGNVLGDITGHGREIYYSVAQREKIASLLGPGSAPDAQGRPAGPVSDSIALLTRSYRFSEASGIGLLAESINRGDGEASLALLQQSGNRLSLQSGIADSVNPASIDWILECFGAVIASETASQALDAFERGRILCALHSGPFGVEAINRRITERLAPKSGQDANGDYQGKPILINANDYELGLFNGDTGVLWRDEEGLLRACFRAEDGGIRWLPIYSLPDHASAWAMTVHKSQGSEYDSVLLVLPEDEDSQAISRELLYTGVTRAMKQLRLHASAAVLIAACARLTRRSSGLAKKLGWD